MTRRRSPRAAPGRTVWPGLLVGAQLLVAPVPAWAQRWQVDAGGSRVSYDDTTQVSSVFFNPQLEWSRPTAFATLGAAAAQSEGDRWSGQGRGALSLFRPLGNGSGGPSLQVAGAASGTLDDAGYETARLEGEVNLHWSLRALGLWVGGGGVSGWAEAPGSWISGVQATAGAWTRSGPTTVSLAWNPLRLEGWWFNQVRARGTLGSGAVDLELSAGWRDGPDGSGVGSDAWLAGSVALWLSERLALAGGGGSYPSDLVQGFQQGQYLSIGLRLAERRQLAIPSTSGELVMVLPQPASASQAGELRFRVPGAGRVTVVGDWNAWTPAPLERQPDGRWLLRVRLPPGTYRFSLIADGGRWVLPDGYPGVDDGFGGKVGVMVVTE